MSLLNAFPWPVFTDNFSLIVTCRRIGSVKDSWRYRLKLTHCVTMLPGNRRSACGERSVFSLLPICKRAWCQFENAQNFCKRLATKHKEKHGTRQIQWQFQKRIDVSQKMLQFWKSFCLTTDNILTVILHLCESMHQLSYPSCSLHVKLYFVMNSIPASL